MLDERPRVKSASSASSKKRSRRGKTPGKKKGASPKPGNPLNRYGTTRRPMGITRICSIQSELMRILHTPERCADFERYLMERYCRENLDFYRAVEKYKDFEAKGKSASDPDVEKFIQEMYQLFIHKDGEKSVTLSAKAVEMIETAMTEKKFDFLMFDLAQREAFELLKMSSVRDYLLEKIRKDQDYPSKKGRTMEEDEPVEPPKIVEEVKLTDILTPDPLFKAVIEKKGDAKALKEFRDFLQKEFASENIDFLFAVHSFRRNSASNRREMEKEARTIFLTYLQAGAQRELTVSADIAAKVRNYFEYSEDDPKALPNREISKEIFDDAVDCVAHVLEYDSLQRYLIQAQQDVSA